MYEEYYEQVHEIGVAASFFGCALGLFGGI
jgi:hypothetical protein